MARYLFVFVQSFILSSFSQICFAQEVGPTTGSQVFSWDFSKAPFYPAQSGEILFNNDLYMMYFNIGQCVPQTLPNTDDFTYSPNVTCVGVANAQGANSFGIFPLGSNAAGAPTANQEFAIELQLKIPTPITATLIPSGPAFIEDYVLDVFLADTVTGNSSSLATCTSSLGQIQITRPFLNVYSAHITIKNEEVAGRHSINLQLQCNKPITSVDTYGGFADDFLDVGVNPVLISKALVTMSEPLQLSISFSQNEVYPTLRPRQLDGSNQTLVTAQLNGSNAADIAGKVIQFSSTPLDLSGGHNHSGGRPTGLFSPILGGPICITDAAGKCSIIFTASEFGGAEVISAKVASDPTKQTSKELTVKVPLLVNLAGGDICFFGVCSSEIYTLVGQTDSHKSNHYLTATSQLAIFGVAFDFYNQFQAKLQLNDMSLENGGLFDIGRTVQFPNGIFWKEPHWLHREGFSVDVRRCAVSTIDNNLNEKGDCPTGFITVPKLKFEAICNDWSGRREPEPTIHCEFKPIKGHP